MSEPVGRGAAWTEERGTSDRRRRLKRALEVIGDEIVDDLIVHGTPQACRERLAEYQAKGLDTPVIAVVPPPGTDAAGIAKFVRQLSRAG